MLVLLEKKHLRGHSVEPEHAQTVDALGNLGDRGITVCQSDVQELEKSERDLLRVWRSCGAQLRNPMMVHILETIHTRRGEITINRHPTLLLPEEAMAEKTIGIFAEKQKPFEKYDASYVIYSIEGYEQAGQWHFVRQSHGGIGQRRVIPRA
jgi:hypothetical protein